MKHENKKRVLMALSGGIDSAVSAYLLTKKGYEVEGAFMKNWSSTTGLLSNECPWLEDRREALRVAAFLGIKLHTLDFEKQYQKNVMNYFFAEYKAGRTPNPDVMCNKEIKFKLLYNWAIKNDFDFLATGHYAQIGLSAKRIGLRKSLALSPQPYTLERSVDEFKDQTYFIYNIKSEQLSHLLFPIGGMKKSAVKKMAEKIGLPNVGRKESMGLCFVGKVRLKEFLGQKLKPKKGSIIGPKGEILGQHEGLQNYTIGQRQGLKVGGIGPFFVYKKDLKTNSLFVTHDPEDKRLFVKELQIHSVNWISEIGLSAKVIGPRKNHLALRHKPLALMGRYRHQGELVSLTISQLKKDSSRPARRAEAELYNVVFKKPQKAIASGQSLVLYKGRECVGGGVIA